jgi:hypothetical protein
MLSFFYSRLYSHVMSVFLPGSVPSSISKSVHKNKTTAEVYVLCTLCFCITGMFQFTEFCARVLAKLWHLEQNWSHQGHLHRASEEGCPHSCYERYCNKLWSNKIKYSSWHNYAPSEKLPLEPTPIEWRQVCRCIYGWSLLSCVADPDLGSSAFLTHGSGSGIQDDHPRSYFRELRNNFMG